MAVTISIALQKGGVGKSTTAQALASTLGFKGRKTLLTDYDPQGNVTYASGVDDPAHTVFDVLAGDCNTADAVIECKYYDIMASDSRLTNVEMGSEIDPTLLKAILANINDRYDYIIIDTPPALGNLSVMAMSASNYVIIPLDPRPFAMTGLGSLYDTIGMIQQRLNPGLKVLGLLLIKYNNRTILNRDIKEMIIDFAEKMNTTVFESTIREGVVVPEAQMMRQPLIDYAKNSKPNIDYKAFTTEVIKMIEGKVRRTHGKGIHKD